VFLTVKKTLSEKEKLMYAPMADVGAVTYDKDAVYISVPEHKAPKKEVESEDEVSGH